MNNKDRKKLEEALILLGESQEIIDSIKESEQEKYENLPEGIQQSEKGQKLEESASLLEEAWDSIDEAIGNINIAIE